MVEVQVDEVHLELPTEATLLSKSGKAHKRTSGWLKRWQPRVLELARHRLTYKRSHSDDKGLRILDFNQISVDLKLSEDTVEIIPHKSKRSFVFRFSDEAVASEWAALLKSHIQGSKGSSQKLPHLVEHKDYWKHIFVSEAEFKANANTGDIILFQGATRLAKLQRAFTRSKYDHVALMVRDAGGELGFFEAIQGTGVSVVGWDEFKSNNWHALYTQISYRRLSAERSEAVLQRLQDFIERVQGRRYKLSIGKLCGSRRTLPATNENDYFCSELSGVCLQVMGYLPNDVVTSRLLPGDFSVKRELPLINGAELGPELLIDFRI
jgi:palmitoyltransferase